MRTKPRTLAALLAGALFAFGLAGATASTTGADETTVSYDNLRTSWDPNEPNLSTAAVTSSDFGQLFGTSVDGQVYAQPIVANGTLITATENDKVYGMDPATGAIRWQVSVGTPWPAGTVSCGDLVPNIGITGTPVYDPSTNAVYFTAESYTTSVTNPTWQLHALNVTTGAELAGFPTTISGAPTNNPSVSFNPETAMQRPGLLLLNGVVYAGFASHCDTTPYTGYVVGVNDTTGKQTTMWSVEASSADEAGIWQSGGGLVSDGAGRIILATGNGVAPAPTNGDTPPSTLGESVVRLAVNSDGSLTAQSFFSPHDNTTLNQDDMDLGSGGPMAIPAGFGTSAHPHLVVQVGKDGRVYLLDADHLGGASQGANGTDDDVSMAGPFNGVWGHPAFWGGDGGYVYTVEANGPLRALKYDNSGATPTLTSVGTSADTFGYTSGSAVITSSGSTSGSSLIWVEYSTGSTGTGGQLRAYNPIPVNGVLQEVYSAPIGTVSKFAVPATDSGRVYVGSRDGKVLGFGRPTTSPLTTQPYDFGSTAVGSTATGSITVTATTSVTVDSVSATAPYAVTGATTPASPVTLAKGATLTVPVSYTPSTWGTTSGNLTFDTSAGSTALVLTGAGTQPGLGASPGTLDFGQVRTGAAKELGVNVVNTGTATETITGATAPNAPFSATNLPGGQTELAPGASTVITVTYTPTNGSATGNTDSGSLQVTSDTGSVTVPLTGVALTGQPELTTTPSTVDFGIVPIGQSVTKTFTVSNTGTVPLTVTKAKAPAGVFSSVNPLAENQVLQPGDEIQQSVTFTPASAYPASADYYITGNDGQGEQAVSLTGNVDPIGAYYAQLGGSRSYLSDPVNAEYSTANGGMAEDFRGGSIYWSAATGAHAVHGVILAHYQALGGPAGALGYPTTDETGTPDGVGRFNHFTGPGNNGASIYWTPNTGAWAVYGAIRAEWAATGWERGPMGYPTTDETGTPDGIGRFNHFTGQNSYGASIYWTAKTGAHAVYGSIRAAWSASGWERGPMGYPTTDETSTPDGIGRYNHFTGQNSYGASIYFSPSTGAHLIYGLIRSKWASMGWERSPLGYPTSDEYSVTGGRRNNFQHGTITFVSANGSVQVAY
ncbi:MAG TPA: choice-of-anchor D domain-containing protein [Pseudonocardiaceae bacterium]|nr:choice-of-anchor D domain-containing protein [Pseudonocardiaceae bacterium]